MKRLTINFLTIACLLAIFLFPAIEATAQVLAFPGADGYAKNITGGRGGKVYHVTRLDDCSDNDLIPGTFRWALHSGDNSPRIIVFDVAGTINVTSTLKSRFDNVSILGQTAPGGGICITGYGLEINGNRNYIIRHLRFRAGEIPCYAEAPEGQHVDVNNGSLGIENSAEVIIDHCSITWSNEECMTMFDDETTTVQNCIIGEGLYHSWHHKYDNNGTSGRGFAMQWGGERVNMHHTLITNSNSRSPRFNGVREEQAWLPGKAGVKKHAHDCFGVSDFANNVIFNWAGSGSMYGGEFYAFRFKDAPDSLDYFSRTYLRNNFYRPGPATQQGARNERYFIRASGNTSEPSLGEWYLDGNKFEVDGTYSTKAGVWAKTELEKVNADNHYGISNGASGRGFNTDNGVSTNIYNRYILKSLPAVDDKYAMSSYQPVSAEEAYAQTLADCGATLPRLDEVDQRLVDEAAGRIAPQFKGSRVGQALGIIDSPNDIKLKGEHDLFWHDGHLTDVVNGQEFKCYPYLGLKEGEKYAVDSDGDGMPDAYEDAIGLNKLDPTDGAKVAANGYTNFENYANGIADGTLRTADYQTSTEFVEPGLAVRKEEITITFQNGYEGNVPEVMKIKNGSTVVFKNNHGIYREGSTVVGWTDGSTTYKFDTNYEGRFTEDITLRPAVVSNLKNLSDRTEEITVTWDFTKSYAPLLAVGNAGVYTTDANIDGNIIDTRLSYNGLALTIPAVEGSIATISYRSGALQTVAAIGETIEAQLQAADVNSVTVTYPFVIDISDKPFHSVKVGNCVVGTEDYVTEDNTWPAARNVADAKNFSTAKATNYELAYANLATIHSVDWMETEGQERDAYRNCINPHGNDEVQYTGNLEVETSVTHAINGFIVGSNKTAGTYKMYAYIKDCALVRTYACGSGSGGDMIQCIAIPLDGSERLMSNNIHKLYKSKQLSEYFDLELDPNMSYRLEWSSVGGVDMMVGAIKFYDNTMQAVNSGDATVKWDWEGEPVKEGITDPAKAFDSAKANIGSAIKAGRGEHGNDPDGNTLYVAQFTETSTVTTHSTDHMIEFTVTPKNGYLFTPTQIDFKRVFSTNKQGQVDIFFKYGDEAEDSVRTTKATSTSTDISIKSSTAAFASKFKTTAKPFSVRLYLNNIPVPEGNINYWVKVFNVAIYGTYAKSTAQRFKFATAVSPANAGVITQSPKGNAFVAESEITLTAIPVGGYKFVNWTNASGNELSTSPQFVFSMPTADQTITANFKELQTVNGPYHIVSTVNELEDALVAAAQSTAPRYYIFLKNGVYDFEKKAMTAIPQNTSLIGESMEGVTIKNCPDVPQGSNSYQDTTPTLFINQNQNDIYLQDLTICQARDWTDKVSRGQALAMRQRGKRVVYKNVTMQGVQDTYYLNKADASAYFEDCVMQGNVDYIYGDGTMWFENCQIKHIGNNGGYITAPNTKAGAYGIVFNGCTVESTNGNGSFYLGRPWDDSPHATYLNTVFRSLPNAAGWAGMTSGLVLRFHEYGSKDAAGNLLDLSKRSISACNAAAGSDNPVLTAEQAAGYTLENVFGNDWKPQILASQLTAPTLYIDRTSGLLTWTPVNEAYAYAVCKNGNVVGFTTETSFAVTDLSATYTLRVANQSGGLGIAGAAAVDGIAEGIEEIISSESITQKPTFTISGQRANKNHHGIIIQGGKKIVVK